jgi:hypothetical protein
MVESTGVESKNRKCRQEAGSAKGIDMFKKHMHEEIWSSSTIIMEIGFKSKSKKRYGQAAQVLRWGQKAQARRHMVKQHKH